jgi:1,4-alpha-glucan branching enzyme
MKRYLFVLVTLISGSLLAQKVTLNPTITPAVFSHNDQITVSYNATGTALANLSNAWIWVWIPGKNINAKYNINPATAAADAAKFTKNGSTWTITFKPSDFFSASISGETEMGMLLKASDWAGGQTTDYVANFGFQIKLTAPTAKPLFAQASEVVNIQAEAPVPANFQLYVNDVLTNSQSNILDYTYAHTITASQASGTIRISATPSAGGTASEVVFQYLIKTNSPVVAKPSGIIEGINYHSDPTTVTLCLLAPGKTSAYALGDFSGWDVLPDNLMNRDGEHFWIELSGLTAGVEYGFQYIVDETLRLADPFADKILDPEDQYIPTESYPNLKTYPSKALSAEWYKNRVSVFQTNQTPYAWQTLNFQRPKKESLVIYELLLRDFFDNGKRNYQTLIDTLPYFKKLGINAIELMPVMEFNGNESWGYNPTFMFAPDKYYGTKNKLKEFIDKCHQNGIAVIFDIAMNHQDVPNPYVMLEFDFVAFKPTANNKMFNVSATHPFSVFFDMNHESSYTKVYLDTVNHYWLNEYKIDGYRFDLSKGFTQTNNPSNVSAWSAYDASRIALLKRMADKIWSHSPTAYVILEHLSENSEEKELAEYRVNEGKGMMLWGKMTDQYNQNTMGFASNSDISGIYYGTRTWTTPRLIGYMESHDEERLMYKNIQFGNSLSNYNVKDMNTALKRMEAASALFYTMPGPKMLWQFGELGFDYSINRCTDGSINNDCRLSIKPTVWEYLDDNSRYSLFEQTANLIKLKKSYSVFQDGTVTFTSDNLVKQAIIKNKNYTTTPLDSTQMSAVVAANFELLTKSVSVSFPHTGTWYNFQAGQSVEVTGASASFSINPGNFMIFTNVAITNPLITAIDTEYTKQPINLYPNPVVDFIETTDHLNSLSLISMTGTRLSLAPVNSHVWDARQAQPGFYVAVGERDGATIRFKVIKK